MGTLGKEKDEKEGTNYDSKRYGGELTASAAP
jgi:hypothetical protein